MGSRVCVQGTGWEDLTGRSAWEVTSAAGPGDARLQLSLPGWAMAVAAVIQIGSPPTPVLLVLLDPREQGSECGLGGKEAAGREVRLLMAASLGSYDLGQHSCSLCSGKAALWLVPELVTLRSYLEPLISSEE